MASYGLEARFKDPNDCFRLNDPSAYNHSRSYGTSYCSTRKLSKNKYGFLSSAPRKTQFYRKPYTNKIYDARVDNRIPNVTSLKSTTPRFSFKPFTEEQLDEILCTCDLSDPCICPTEPVHCNAYVHKRIFKGRPPHSIIGDGLSIPTKRDRGFEILPDGSTRRRLDVVKEECPPFYDARMHCSCEFYRGCKWSLRREPRMGPKTLEVRPGPADYTIEREKTEFELCMEQFRAEKRKYSKQLRYIEIVQERNIREDRVGPSDYYPQMPKCTTDLKFLMPRQARFPITKLEKRPSPDTYYLKRDFDPPEAPLKRCNAKLPAPASFGTRAPRFIRREKHGPSPTEYDPRVKLCNIVHCSDAPFGCSAKRFPEEKVYSDCDEDLEECEEETEIDSCPKLTWPFRSRTERFKKTTNFVPLVNLRTPPTHARPLYLQELSPFNSSQGRFQPWFDWLPHHHGEGPGPCEYNANKAKCPSAVYHGPLYRTRRFKENVFITPAPNTYCIRGGVEDVLKTYNKNLQVNVNRVGKFECAPLPEHRQYSFAERELSILERAIRQLEIDDKMYVLKEETSCEGGSKRASTQVETKRISVTAEDKQNSAQDKRNSVSEPVKIPPSEDTNLAAVTEVINVLQSVDTKSSKPKIVDNNQKGNNATRKQKLLRTFLYKHEMPNYY